MRFGISGLENRANQFRSFSSPVSHFSLWSILKSPLILGNDIRNMTEATLSIIANKVMISMNQDSLSSTAGQIWSKDVLADLASPSATFAEWEVKPTTAGSLSLWSGALSDGYVVTLFNSSPKNLTLDVDLAEAFSPIDYVRLTAFFGLNSSVLADGNLNLFRALPFLRLLSLSTTSGALPPPPPPRELRLTPPALRLPQRSLEKLWACTARRSQTSRLRRTESESSS